MYAYAQRKRRLVFLTIGLVLVLVTGLIVLLSSCQASPSSSGNGQSTTPGTLPGSSAEGNFPNAYFSPYVDVTLLDPAHPFAQLAPVLQPANGNLHYFTLAFVTARAGCQATWGGEQSIDPQDPLLLKDIQTLRQQGGDITVAFGGPLASLQKEQQDLALACPNEQSLQAQYQSVLENYQLSHMDIMLEGDLLNDQNSINMRNQALAGLHSGVVGQSLAISYSLPVTPNGLSQPAYACLENALQHHVPVTRLNLLLTPASTFTDLAGSLTKALGSVKQQLLQIQQRDKLTGSISLGLTPLIGEDSQTSSTFTLANAQDLVAFARTQVPALNELSMWSLQRDRACAAGDTVSLAQGLCSGIQQQSYDFSRLLNSFTIVKPGQSPTPTPALTPTPTPSPSPTVEPVPTQAPAVPTPVPTQAPEPTPTAAPQNYLVNPTFNGLSGWNCQSPDVAQNHTLRILPTASTNGLCTQTVENLLPNHTYTLKASVKGSYAYIQAEDQVKSLFSTNYTTLSLSFNTGDSTCVVIMLYAGQAQPEVDMKNVSLLAT